MTAADGFTSARTRRRVAWPCSPWAGSLGSRTHGVWIVSPPEDTADPARRSELGGGTGPQAAAASSSGAPDSMASRIARRRLNGRTKRTARTARAERGGVGTASLSLTAVPPPPADGPAETQAPADAPAAAKLDAFRTSEALTELAKEQYAAALVEEAQTFDTMETKLGTLLLKSSIKVEDLMLNWDRNHDGDISRTEFRISEHVAMHVAGGARRAAQSLHTGLRWVLCGISEESVLALTLCPLWHPLSHPRLASTPHMRRTTRCAQFGSAGGGGFRAAARSLVRLIR